MDNSNILNIIVDECNKQANSFSYKFLLESYRIINDKFIEIQGSIYQNSIGKKVSALFDINGRKLIPISESEDKLFKVSYENNNNLLIEYYKIGKIDEPIKKVVHYKYNEKTNNLVNINSFENEQNLPSFYTKYGDNNKTTLVINVYDKIRNYNKKQLYSLKKESFVSPKIDEFELINETDDKLYFMFTDTVYSFDTFNGEKISTFIRGAITNEGEIFNKIYVDYDNTEKICELNNHENFMQYRALKNYISRNLDIKIARLEEEQRRKESSLKNYMVKVKKFYNR